MSFIIIHKYVQILILCGQEIEKYGFLCGYISKIYKLCSVKKSSFLQLLCTMEGRTYRYRHVPRGRNICKQASVLVCNVYVKQICFTARVKSGC